MTTTDKSARCKFCGVSQRERFKECIDGNKLHRFIRTQIPTYESELKQIWISKHPLE
jgi:hypothetical protein